MCGSCEEGDGYAEGFDACEEVEGGEGVRLVKLLIWVMDLRCDLFVMRICI